MKTIGHASRWPSPEDYARDKWPLWWHRVLFRSPSPSEINQHKSIKVYQQASRLIANLGYLWPWVLYLTHLFFLSITYWTEPADGHQHHRWCPEHTRTRFTHVSSGHHLVKCFWVDITKHAHWWCKFNWTNLTFSASLSSQAAYSTGQTMSSDIAVHQKCGLQHYSMTCCCNSGTLYSQNPRRTFVTVLRYVVQHLIKVWCLPDLFC